MVPKFSLLMANYNCAEYITDAVESILKQSFAEWELIIVDDASTDNSAEVIRKYLGDRRIKLVKINDARAYPGSVKRECAFYAKGEIIGIVDSDDALAKDALEKIVAEYNEDSEAGLIYSEYYECDNNLENKRLNPDAIAFSADKMQLPQATVHHFFTFKRSDYLKTAGFDPEMRIAEDKDLIFKLEEVTPVGFINEPLYFYRRRADGITAPGRKSREARLWNIRAVLKAYQRRKVNVFKNITEAEMAGLLYEGLLRAIILGDWKFARYFLNEARQFDTSAFWLSWFIIKKGMKKVWKTGH